MCACACATVLACVLRCVHASVRVRARMAVTARSADLPGDVHVEPALGAMIDSIAKHAPKVPEHLSVRPEDCGSAKETVRNGEGGRKSCNEGAEWV